MLRSESRGPLVVNYIGSSMVRVFGGVVLNLQRGPLLMKTGVRFYSSCLTEIVCLFGKIADHNGIIPSVRTLEGMVGLPHLAAQGRRP